MLLKRSARFAVATDGTVTIRRRPLVTTCHLLCDALERFDDVLDDVPAYVSDGSRRHLEPAWLLGLPVPAVEALAAVTGRRRAVTATARGRN